MFVYIYFGPKFFVIRIVFVQIVVLLLFSFFSFTFSLKRRISILCIVWILNTVQMGRVSVCGRTRFESVVWDACVCVWEEQTEGGCVINSIKLINANLSHRTFQDKTFKQWIQWMNEPTNQQTQWTKHTPQTNNKQSNSYVLFVCLHFRWDSLYVPPPSSLSSAPFFLAFFLLFFFPLSLSLFFLESNALIVVQYLVKRFSARSDSISIL